MLSVSDTSASLRVKDSGRVHRLNWRGPALTNWLVPGSEVDVRRDKEYYKISSHIRTKDAELVAWVIDANQPLEHTLNRLDQNESGKWKAVCGIEGGEGVVYSLEISKNGDQTIVAPGQTLVLDRTVITLLEAAYHNNSDFNGGKRFRAFISMIRVNEDCAIRSGG